ncbi:hypothetical protein HK405_009698 [Cladochytrium tenue]|nr:hypothetical protein HK405_009698 [Cladochytrium tenue]
MHPSEPDFRSAAATATEEREEVSTASSWILSPSILDEANFATYFESLQTYLLEDPPADNDEDDDYGPAFGPPSPAASPSVASLDLALVANWGSRVNSSDRIFDRANKEVFRPSLVNAAGELPRISPVAPTGLTPLRLEDTQRTQEQQPRLPLASADVPTRRQVTEVTEISEAPSHNRDSVVALVSSEVENVAHSREEVEAFIRNLGVGLYDVASLCVGLRLSAAGDAFDPIQAGEDDHRPYLLPSALVTRTRAATVSSHPSSSHVFAREPAARAFTTGVLVFRHFALFPHPSKPSASRKSATLSFDESRRFTTSHAPAPSQGGYLTDSTNTLIASPTDSALLARKPKTAIKIMDLELANGSLLAVNEGLESTIREQAATVEVLRNYILSLQPVHQHALTVGDAGGSSRDFRRIPTAEVARPGKLPRIDEAFDSDRELHEAPTNPNDPETKYKKVCDMLQALIDEGSRAVAACSRERSRRSTVSKLAQRPSLRISMCNNEPGYKATFGDLCSSGSRAEHPSVKNRPARTLRTSRSFPSGLHPRPIAGHASSADSSSRPAKLYDRSGQLRARASCGSLPRRGSGVDSTASLKSPASSGRTGERPGTKISPEDPVAVTLTGTALCAEPVSYGADGNDGTDGFYGRPSSLSHLGPRAAKMPYRPAVTLGFPPSLHLALSGTPATRTACMQSGLFLHHARVAPDAVFSSTAAALEASVDEQERAHIRPSTALGRYSGSSSGITD